MKHDHCIEHSKLEIMQEDIQIGFQIVRHINHPRIWGL